MTHRHEYDTYRRGNAVISLRDQGRMPRGFQLEAVRRRITDTLDIIPESHINLFGTGGNIRVGSIPATGGGHNPTIPHIRLSYNCFDGAREHSYNNGRLSYTLLHEMGHIVDKSIQPTCMEFLASEFPLGCLGILSRYHGGGTRGVSEHYADIYADYFYNEIGGLSYNVLRAGRSAGCSDLSRPCTGCESMGTRLRRGLSSGHSLPSGRNLTSLRYDALFRSPPFRGVSRIGEHASYMPPTPDSEADLSGVASHCAYKIPQSGPTRRT